MPVSRAKGLLVAPPQIELNWAAHEWGNPLRSS
jgi:hypothetical protein